MTIKVKLGPVATLQTSGKLIGVHKPVPKEAKTSLVAPGTTEKVKQYYIPESLVGQDLTADQLLTRDMCDTVVAIKDKITSETSVTALPESILDDIKGSALPKNVMNITVHTAADADSQMFPLKDAQSYVFYPDEKDPDNIQNYNLLAGILRGSDLAFVSVMNLQNHEGLFRLQMWRDRIILVKQGWPEGINEHTPPTEGEFSVAPVPQQVIDKAIKGFTKLVEPIEAETYKNRVLQEKLALKAAVDSGEVVETVKATPEVSVASLDALLDMFNDD